MGIEPTRMKIWPFLFFVQLRKQSLSGYVFDGWHEGTMSFAPTYKYEFDSTEYVGGKQRAPAW